MSNGKLVKPLSELSVHEVGIVLEALKLGKYKETLINNEIDGKCLVECYTVEDVVNMGISLVVKARVFLNEVMIWKANGVPMEYFSVYQATNRENNDAEDRIDEVKDTTMNVSVKAKYFLKEIKKLQQLMKADDGTEVDDINTEMQLNMITTHTVELFA